MTIFDDREKAFENRFAHDQDLAFRAEARCNRRIGLWAAALMGKSGAAAEDYAAELLASALSGGGSEAVIARLNRDFAAAEVKVSDHHIRREMDATLAAVMHDLMSE